MEDRLSKISTMWSVLESTRGVEAAEAAEAQAIILAHYGGAVRRYLLAAVRDANVADDLFQEFALSLLRGQFQKADPEKGRFRDYLKSALFHLVYQYRKRQQRSPVPLTIAAGEGVEVAAPAEEMDRVFDQGWREDLLSRAWTSLAKVQPNLHTVLRFRADHPEMSSAEMAARLESMLGTPMSANGIRQSLRRAREAFAEFLLEQVALSLRSNEEQDLQEELSVLNLLEYCRPILDQRRRMQ